MRAMIRKDVTVIVDGRPALTIAAGSEVIYEWPKHPDFKIYFKGNRLYIVRRRRRLNGNDGDRSGSDQALDS